MNISDEAKILLSIACLDKLYPLNIPTTDAKVIARQGERCGMVMALCWLQGGHKTEYQIGIAQDFLSGYTKEKCEKIYEEVSNSPYGNDSQVVDEFVIYYLNKTGV